MAVRNDSDKDFILPRHIFIGFVEAFDECDAYQVDMKPEAVLAEQRTLNIVDPRKCTS